MAAKKGASSSQASQGPPWALLGAAAALALAVAAAGAYQFLGLGAPEVLRPLRAKRLTDLPASPAYAEQMLWGSYRSGLYFGMRTRKPKSLVTGLLWFDPDSPSTLMEQRVRHQASQDDRLQRYGWVRHDGRTWGQQVLVDGTYNLTLTMVKHQGPSSGVGGDWAVRVHVARSSPLPRDVDASAPRPPKRISLVMYISDEDKPKAPWSVLPFGEPENLKDGVQLVSGGSKTVGRWSLHVVDSTSGGAAAAASGKRKRGARLNYLSLPSVEGEHDFRISIKELLLSVIYENLQRNPTSDKFHMELPNGLTTGSDMAVFQVTLPVGGTVDWVFLSTPSAGGGGGGAAAEARVAELSGEALTALIRQRGEEFDTRFAQKLAPAASPAAGKEEGGEEGEEGAPDEAAVREVAKAALSNLLGSMGYFYGQSKEEVCCAALASAQVRLPGKEEPAQYWPTALYTAVPSRSFFPRGFLWDEGFHQLLVQRWDGALSRDVLGHWLDLMNAQGWIPREQILGAEAERRVPAEFVVQDPLHANPPSLFLPISVMAEQLAGTTSDPALQVSDEERGEIRSFLAAAWPRLEVWFSWFNTTQAGPLPHSYRWRGRDGATTRELNPKTLTSGLDDYPRASHPTDDERHLDLRCWMALASKAMATIGASLGLGDAVVARYQRTAAALSDIESLDAQHWDEARGQYLDWGLHTEDVALVPALGNQGELVRAVDSPPSLRHVPHFGYVSLFPLLMRLLPAGSPRLGALLAQLRRQDLLWTPHGLRSLSADSSLYKQHNTAHDKPYWRGQVWININYLALVALRHYARTPGPYQETAAGLERDLRRALTKTLVSEYHDNGYLFEQYDDRTGRGTSSHPFTGWTALVALIATNSY